MYHQAEKCLFKTERIQTINKMLLERFPNRTVLIVSIFNLIAALGSFSMELFSIIKQTYLYYLAFGYFKKNN